MRIDASQFEPLPHCQGSDSVTAHNNKPVVYLVGIRYWAFLLHIQFSITDLTQSDFWLM